jgi:hypothetical protein
MHIPRDISFLIASVIVLWFGMWIAATGFGVITHV